MYYSLKEALLFSFIVVLSFGISKAQCPVSSFTNSVSVCSNESVSFTNSSTGTEPIAYEWDFCSGELATTPIASSIATISTANNPTGLTIQQEGENWYAFITSRGNGTIQRTDFGNNINNPPNVIGNIDLSNVSSFINGPESITFINESGIWYGIVTNYNDHTLALLEFGSSITNTPTDASFITLPMGVTLFRPSEIEWTIIDGDYVLLVSNRGTFDIARLIFNSTITADPTGESIGISGSSRPRSLELVRECENWYAFVASENNGRIHRLSFGTDLTGPVNVMQMTNNGDELNPLYRLEIVNDNDQYYGIGTSSSTYGRIDLGSSISLNMIPTDLGSLGGLTSALLGFDLIKENGNFIGLAIATSTNELFRITYDFTCNENVSTSTETEPQGIQYAQEGTYTVNLKVTDSDGLIDYSSQSVTVSSLVAPDISFTFDNQCISSPTVFTSSNQSGNIDTYTWDFGDGSPTSNDPNPTNDYSLTMGAGIYDVRLDVVSDEMCTNFSQQTIQIFNPPTADFADIAGTPCSGEALNFTNQSTFDVGSPITYSWDFNGEGSSNDANPTFTFQFGGLKDVTLTTSIPGCSDMITKQVNVQFGAIPDFSFSNICLGEVATFTDLSNGAGTTITDYDWDFGDGNTSTLQNPTNPYAATGDYNVSLTVTNNLGCSVTDIQTISVHANPIAAFTNDPACEGPVQFTDQTTVESANITQWLWDFDNGETATEEDPIANFSQSTEFDVSLIATSNFGCSDETSQTISVLSAPTPEFTVLQGCLGESVQFNDETIIESINPVTSYFWEIDDEVYSVMNPEHTFNAVGTFTARMTLTVANGCVVVSEQQVVVPAVPTPEFSVTTACVNSVTIFEDQSLDEGDPIISRTWDFDGLATANGPMAQFVFSQSGNYNISLTTVSTLGCTAFIGKTITVNEQPTAAFSSSTTLGPPPLSVNFTNQSEESTSYSWLLNDDVNPFSTEEHAALLFEEEGDFQVSLVSFNEFGCTDTLTQIIEVVFPATDLALDEVIAVPNNGKTNIVLRGANRGTLAIDGFDIIINIEDDITLIEEFDQTLLKNQPFVHTLNFDLQGEGSNVEFICIDLQLREVEEPNRDNNQQCINFEQEVIIQEPFPNPASENLRVNVIVPEVSDGVQITLMSIYGETIVDEMVSEPLEGLNIFDFNVNALTSGLYIVRIRYDGVEEVRRVNVE